MLYLSVKVPIFTFIVATMLALPNTLALSQVKSDSTLAQEKQKDDPVLRQRTHEVSIGDGDLLEVTVLGAPDFAKQIRVSSTGDISLPLIGNVKVAGLSTASAEQIVA